MTLVTVPQAQPNDELTDELINRGSNAIAAVLNGNVDDDNISSLSGTKISAGTLPVSALDTDQDDLTPADGWVPANETWTYASATTFTVAGDRTTKYSTGARVRFTQSATVKYGAVKSATYSAPNTTVELVAASDSIANAVITDNSYSRTSNQEGFSAGSEIQFAEKTGTVAIGSAQNMVTFDGGLAYIQVTIPKNARAVIVVAHSCVRNDTGVAAASTMSIMDGGAAGSSPTTSSSTIANVSTSITQGFRFQHVAQGILRFPASGTRRFGIRISGGSGWEIFGTGDTKITAQVI